MSREIGVVAGAAVVAAAIVGGALYAVLDAAGETESPSSTSGEIAYSDAPPYVTDTTRVERVAKGLRKDVLFVDPIAADALSPKERAAVVERASAAEVPVRIAVVPLIDEDESGGDAEVFAHALHHVLGDDAVYLVATPASVAPVAEAVAFDVPVASYDLIDTTPADFDEDTTLVQSLDHALDVVDKSAASEPQVESSPVPSAVSVDDAAPDPPRSSRFFSEGFWPGLLLLGPILAGLLFGLVWTADRVVRSSRKSRRTLAAAGEGLHEAARPRRAPARPSRSRLERMARTEVAALRTGVAAADPEHPGMADAMRALDGALLLIDEDHDELDLVGVVVLARDARQRISGERAGTPQEVCMANPLHGAAGIDRRTLPGIGTRLPVCVPCAELSRSGLESAVLRVSDGGTKVRHYTLDRLWIRTRYGAVGSDLPTKVLEALDAR